MKPCNITCPMCGSTDIYRKWIGEGVEHHVPNDPETLDPLKRHRVKDAAFIRQHCRICAYEWDTPTMPCPQLAPKAPETFPSIHFGRGMNMNIHGFKGSSKGAESAATETEIDLGSEETGEILLKLTGITQDDMPAWMEVAKRLGGQIGSMTGSEPLRDVVAWRGSGFGTTPPKVESPPSIDVDKIGMTSWQERDRIDIFDTDTGVHILRIENCTSDKINAFADLRRALHPPKEPT